MEQISKLKRPWSLAPVLQIVQKIPEGCCLYLYLLIGLTEWVVVQQIYSKMHPISYTNIHHEVIDLVNERMVKITQNWVSWKRNIIFLRNYKILNLCLRWHILKSYRFVAEVIFKGKVIVSKNKTFLATKFV